ncbi:hypothetical protein DFQ27_004069 [Actinomortierella ambigua]|uniref:Membrane-associated protein n=1 Tax=Actinomortierella ambigua TaxID=1343610 RepID=A0A9P6Q2V0_9FUNG|nr:hypothetical protein DFQ27_004069 [Actinomortierella ambigua]
MTSRSLQSRVGHAATLAFVLLMCLKTTLADLLCTQFGSNTFRVGSTLKFQWNDTQTVPIDSFNLNLYCVENSKLIIPNIVPSLSTLTSPSPVTWVVPSDIATHSSECSLNQYFGAFVWSSADPGTGAVKEDMSRCMTLLFVNPNAPGTPGNSGNGGNEDSQQQQPQQPSSPQQGPTNVDEDGNIIVSDQTKSIVIGVGCAVGVLVLAGIVGFYVIRYRNKRAAEEEQSRKLREPIRQGPLFPPSSSGRSSPTGGGISDGSGDGNAGMVATTAHTARLGQSRYNELSSNVSTSDDHGDQFSNHRHSQTTEMSEFGGGAAMMMVPPPPLRTATPPPPASSSQSSASPRPSTPIAAQHAKHFRGSSSSSSSAAFSPTMTYSLSPLATATANNNHHPNGQLLSGTASSGDRPVSVLTSSFIPMEDEADHRKKQQQQQQQYELQIQLQHQQQQQTQQYMNYGSY